MIRTSLTKEPRQELPKNLAHLFRSEDVYDRIEKVTETPQHRRRMESLIILMQGEEKIWDPVKHNERGHEKEGHSLHSQLLATCVHRQVLVSVLNRLNDDSVGADYEKDYDGIERKVVEEFRLIDVGADSPKKNPRCRAGDPHDSDSFLCAFDVDVLVVVDGEKYTQETIEGDGHE